MRTVYELQSTATVNYPEAKQTIAQYRNKSYKKLGKSYDKLHFSGLLKRTIKISGMLLFSLALLPWIFSSFRHSLKRTYKEIKNSKEKVIHYVLLPQEPKQTSALNPVIDLSLIDLLCN